MIRQFSLSPIVTLLCIALLAVALRWDNYSRTYFADELIPLAVVQHMQATGSLDTNWENADWSGDYAGAFYKLKQYNFSSYHTALYGFQTAWQFVDKNTKPLVIYRAFSVLCQILALLFIFLITQSLFGASPALIAASFFAVVPQAVVDSHYARPESFVILLVALACWCAVHVCHSKKLQFVLLEAFIWGMAFACKFSFYPMAILAFIASCWVLKRWWIVLLWPTIFLVGVTASAPYLVKDIQGFVHGIGLLLHQYAAQPVSGVWLSYFPSLLPMAKYLSVFFTVPVFIVMTMALAFQGIKGRIFIGIALFVSVFYVAGFSTQGVFFERNLSHLLPLWSVMFGVGSMALLKIVKTQWAYISMFFCLVACVFWLLSLSVVIDKEMFVGLDANKKLLAEYEKSILQEFHAKKVKSWNIMQELSNIKEDDGSIIYRVPMPKVPELSVLEQTFSRAGYQKIVNRKMPLSFLPYSQLQINQLPPVYAYYQRINHSEEGK